MATLFTLKVTALYDLPHSSLERFSPDRGTFSARPAPASNAAAVRGSNAATATQVDRSGRKVAYHASGSSQKTFTAMNASVTDR